MASKIDNFDFNASKTTYDWNSWFDGSVWQLVRGKDFACKTSSMRSIIFGRAIARELQVTTSVKGDTIYLKVTGKLVK